MKELVFLTHGAVELLDENGETIWTSSTDDEFKELFEGKDFFNEAEDLESISEYLIAIEELDDDEEINVTEETLESEVEGYDDHDDIPI